MAIGQGQAYADMELLLATVQAQTPLGEFEHIVSGRDYPFLEYLFSKRRMISGGDHVEHDVVLQPNGNLRFVLPGEECPVGNQEGMQKVKVGWAISNLNMSWEERELKANRGGLPGARKIQDYYKAKREQNIVIPWVEGHEAAALQVPNDTTDNRRPTGIPAWICFAPTSTAVDTMAFNGQTMRYADGSTSTITGGIDRSQTRNSLFRNLTYVHNSKYDTQFLKAMMEFYKRGRFKKPPKSKNVTDSSPASTVIFCGIEVWLDLWELAESRMVKGKKDLIAEDGELKFNGIPIINAPSLDYDSTNFISSKFPLYWVDMSGFIVWTREGEFMRESEPIRYGATRHRTWVIQVDTEFNFMCFNARKQGVMHAAFSSYS